MSLIALRQNGISSFSNQTETNNTLKEDFTLALQSFNFKKMEELLDRGVDPYIKVPINLELYYKAFCLLDESNNDFSFEYLKETIRNKTEQDLNEELALRELFQMLNVNPKNANIEEIFVPFPAFLFALLCKQESLVQSFIDKGVKFTGVKNFLKENASRVDPDGNLFKDFYYTIVDIFCGLIEKSEFVAIKQAQDLGLIDFNELLTDRASFAFSMILRAAIYAENIEILKELEALNFFEPESQDAEKQNISLLEDAVSSALYLNKKKILNFFEKYLPNDYYSHEDRNKQIYYATGYGRDALDFVLSKGGDIHAPHPFGNQNQGILSYAAEYKGNKEVFERLIELGANINDEVEIDEVYDFKTHEIASREEICNPLNEAASTGNFEAFDFLLNLDPTKLNNRIFISACQGGNTQIIQKLLDLGFDINFNQGEPLIAATHYPSNASLIDFLLKSGADPSLRKEGEKLPIFLAARKCSKDALMIFEKHGVDLYQVDEEKKTLLSYAIVNHGYPDSFDFLIKKGLNPNSIDDKGENIFFHLTQYDVQEDTLKRLLDFGVDINHVNNEGETILSKAVMETLTTYYNSSYEEKLKQILTCGPHLSSSLNDHYLVERIIDAKIDWFTFLTPQDMEERKKIILQQLLDAGLCAQSLSNETKIKLKAYVGDIEIFSKALEKENFDHLNSPHGSFIQV